VHGIGWVFSVIVGPLKKKTVYRVLKLLLLLFRQAVEHWISHCDSIQMVLLHNEKPFYKLKQQTVIKGEANNEQCILLRQPAVATYPTTQPMDMNFGSHHLFVKLS
jgi:hypothetical protein